MTNDMTNIEDKEHASNMHAEALAWVDARLQDENKKNNKAISEIERSESDTIKTVLNHLKDDLDEKEIDFKQLCDKWLRLSDAAVRICNRGVPVIVFLSTIRRNRISSGEDPQIDWNSLSYLDDDFRAALVMYVEDGFMDYVYPGNTIGVIRLGAWQDTISLCREMLVNLVYGHEIPKKTPISLKELPATQDDPVKEKLRNQVDILVNRSIADGGYKTSNIQAGALRFLTGFREFLMQPEVTSGDIPLLFKHMENGIRLLKLNATNCNMMPAPKKDYTVFGLMQFLTINNYTATLLCHQHIISDDASCMAKIFINADLLPLDTSDMRGHERIEGWIEMMRRMKGFIDEDHAGEEKNAMVMKYLNDSWSMLFFPNGQRELK